MDLQSILAALLNPGGTQQAGGAPPMLAGAVGDHNDPRALQQAMMQFQQPQAAPQQAPQAFATQQAPQQPGMPQSAPQAAPAQRGGGFGDFVTGLFDPQAKNRNVTRGWLEQQGLDPGTATIIASDKGLLRNFIAQRQQGRDPSEFDQRAQAARQYGLDPSTPEGRNFILSGKLPEQRGGAAELGLNPQYGLDEKGNPVLLQLGKDGKVVKSAMPDGVTLSKAPIKMDAGTHFVLLDPITRQPIGTIPKDLAGAAAQNEFGKQQGGVAFDLPRIEQNAEQTLHVIEQLKAHPGRATATGLSGTLDPRNYIAGTDATNFNVLREQAQGQVFLQAYQTLKGGGQITEVEGQKAQNAIARLNKAQSDGEFMAALNDFESVIRAGLDRARKQAGQQPPSSPPAMPLQPSQPGGDTPPASYEGDPAIWKYMTPEQKKLWQ